MSIGNTKDNGNKGNNFPYQLKSLQLLSAINQSVIDNGTPAVTVNTVTDPTALDAFGRQRVSNPTTLFDSSYRFGDNGLWSTLAVTGGTAIFNPDQGLMDLSVNDELGSSVIRETNKVFSYQPGKSLLVFDSFVMNPAKIGLRQRVGFYGDNNGFYLQLNDHQLSFVKRSFVTGSVVNTVVPQSNWNYDQMDGSGPSGITLDISKAQILWLDMEWLGVGTVRMGFVIDGKFYICHKFNHANFITSTYITTANLPLRYEIKNTLETIGASTLKQICSSVISEGGYELKGEPYTVQIPINSPKNFLAANTYYPIIGIRLSSSKLDGIAILTALSILGLGNGKNYAWRIIEGCTITDGSWVSAGASSAVEYNISGTSISGGTSKASGYLNSSNQASPVVNILKGGLFTNQLERNGLTSTPIELVLEAAIDSTGGLLGMFASIDWEEITR